MRKKIFSRRIKTSKGLDNLIEKSRGIFPNLLLNMVRVVKSDQEEYMKNLRRIRGIYYPFFNFVRMKTIPKNKRKFVEWRSFRRMANCALKK